MMFSYVGLFKTWSGGFINKEQQEQYESSSNLYLTQTTRLIHRAASIAHMAKQSAETLAAYEEQSGRTHALTTSQYLRNLQKKSTIPFERLPQGPTAGPIHIFWKQTAEQVGHKETILAAAEKLIQDSSASDKPTTLSVGDKVRLVSRLERTINWALIQEFIEGEGDKFIQPVAPTLHAVGGGEDSKATTERQWAIDALRAIWKFWDPATIGVPLAFAVGLDLVVFLIPLAFRDRSGGALRSADIIAALRTVDVNGGNVPEQAIRAVLNRLRSGSPSKWWLQGAELRRLDPVAIAIVEQLARKHAIWPARFSDKFCFPRATYECLSHLVLTR